MEASKERRRATHSMNYDYIIVGAGSAGCILANRLSASGEHSVLLLEAGGRDDSFWFKIPVGFTKTYYNETYNWMYYSEPEPQLDNRPIYCPRGKVQGGSGSINAMIYVRGQPRDFDDWHEGRQRRAGRFATCCRISAAWNRIRSATRRFTAPTARSASRR